MNKIIEAHKFFLKKVKVICKGIQIGTITQDYQKHILNICVYVLNQNKYETYRRRTVDDL